MTLYSIRKISDTCLKEVTASNLPITLHILEPEYHQDIYTEPIEKAKNSPYGAFQLGDPALIEKQIGRGKQPDYADDIDNIETLEYIGKLQADGSRLTPQDTTNIVALKSVNIRSGYVDLDSARSVSEDYYTGSKRRSGIIKNDLLINSTGDGTIGRVAVYHYDFPAVVDGHVSVIRFKKPEFAWYAAAYLLSDLGQHQIYRYINGSSGQVEIYPQDIARLWVPMTDSVKVEEIANSLKTACERFIEFTETLKLSSAFFG